MSLKDPRKNIRRFANGLYQEAKPTTKNSISRTLPDSTYSRKLRKKEINLKEVGGIEKIYGLGDDRKERKMTDKKTDIAPEQKQPEKVNKRKWTPEKRAKMEAWWARRKMWKFTGRDDI